LGYGQYILPKKGLCYPSELSNLARRLRIPEESN
jgi:hypothetical protein